MRPIKLNRHAAFQQSMSWLCTGWPQNTRPEFCTRNPASGAGATLHQSAHRAKLALARSTRRVCGQADKMGSQLKTALSPDGSFDQHIARARC